MNDNFTRNELSKGVFFNSIIDNRFKTNRISVNFIVPLDKKYVTINALIPFILRKGSRKLPDFTAFSAALENLYGASADCDIMKLGDNQVLTLSISSIDDKFTFEKNDDLIQNLSNIIADMTLDPVIINDGFDEKEVELEKNALIDTIEAEINEKRIYALNNTVKLMCENEPYGIPKYGYKEDVGTINSISAYNAYMRLIKTARIEIMFTGCGDYEKTYSVFLERFKNIDRLQINDSITSTHKFSGSIKTKNELMSVTQSKMVIGFSSDIKEKENMLAAARLMVCVLGGTPTSKLFLNVRERLSLCYYCAARFDKYKGILLIYCGVEKE
ncbi:MAG: insulinase family protein, partial [Oscillospiraceae bacterium]